MAKMTKKIRVFNTQDVARMHGLVPVRQTGDEVAYNYCASCGRYGTMSINIAKDLWRCPACDASGSAVELHILLSENGKYVGEAGYKQALRDILKAVRNDETFETAHLEGLQRVKMTINCELADVSQRNAVYTAMSRLLPLKEEHRMNLLKRGISEENIARDGYVSIPETDRDVENLIVTLQRMGFDLRGVPPFYESGNRIKMVVPKNRTGRIRSGFYCWARDENRMLCGAQMRMDDTWCPASKQMIDAFAKIGLSSKDAEQVLEVMEKTKRPNLGDYVTKKLVDNGFDPKPVPEFHIRKDGAYTIKRRKGGKYIWMSSSSMNMGSSTGSIANFRLGKDPSRMIITEGLLKADSVADQLNDVVSVLGLAGVQSMNPVEKWIKKLPENALVLVCYDMDKHVRAKTQEEKETSDGILAAEKKLCGFLEKNHVRYHVMTWDYDKEGYWSGRKETKGLDDFLHSCSEDMRMKFIRYIKSL